MLRCWLYCVIFWAYESIFCFRADLSAEKWILFQFECPDNRSLGPQRLSFFSVRHNLMASQVKCNKKRDNVIIPTRRFFFSPHISAMERSQEQQLKLAVIQHLAQGHFSMTDAGQVRSLNLLYISAVGFSAVGRSSTGRVLIKPSLAPGMSSRQRCQLSNENSAHSECKRRLLVWRLFVPAIFARLA